MDKTKLCLVAFVIVLGLENNLFGQVKSSQNPPRGNWQNLKYLEFQGFNFEERADSIDKVDPDGEMLFRPGPIWRAKEIARWKSAVEKAAVMLPESVFKKTGKIRFPFFLDRSIWTTAHVEFKFLQEVHINLFPSHIKPRWMTWEPLPWDGVSETEMMWIAIHEIAHVYSFLARELDHLYYMYHQYCGVMVWDKELNKPVITSLGVYDDEVGLLNVSFSYYKSDREHYTQLYGVTWATQDKPSIDRKNIFVRTWHLHPNFEDKELLMLSEPSPTLYGRHRGEIEDFADTFALYVLWPEYLKSDFPLHYEVIKKILGREYKSVYPIPNSIKSKLTVGEK